MSTLPHPTPDSLSATIRTCIENGERILEETFDLEFRNPPSTRFFLITIAQEEFAKAFILHLIKEAIVPFTSPVLRAINDHACKHLVGMIMDYMIMHWDDIEELRASIKEDHDLGDQLPDDVGSAMELLRFEKIGRWTANNWFWVDDPKYDKAALRIAEGTRDRHKQDALYIRVGRDGRVASTPQVITKNETHEELERAKRYKYLVKTLQADGDRPYRHEKAITALKILFGSL
jgi:AbiV